MYRPIFIAVLILGANLALAQEKSEFGHSHLGSAFDSGLRSKPWRFQGLGSAPFPISTKVKDVQSWYNQGNELLHSFWFEEAERTFRWCLKLDKENAMVYFGLARCGLNWFSVGQGESPQLKRFREFLKEAVKRKNKVTERERLYIEAWDAAWSKSGEDARKVMVKRLQGLCVKFPDDLEAKVQLSFYNIEQGSALANDLLIRQVLAVNPKHPGALHAQIHNWDDVDGRQAINSCELYGQAAPAVGHALHMPGHIYAGIGMWHEAAIAMDSATRVELRHMTERFAFPFENWNYPHNRDYLSYIQEQLGRAKASIQGSRDIIHSPTDPAAGFSYPGALPLMRALIKFEMWNEILTEELPGANVPWVEPIVRSARAIAQIESGQLEEARKGIEKSSAELKKLIDEEVAKSPENAEKLRKEMEDTMPSIARVAEAKLLGAEGKKTEALAILTQLAEKEKIAREKRQLANDPPSDPWPASRLVADLHLASGEPDKAIEAYKQTLDRVPNDAWCLGGLAKAYVAKGDRNTAKEYADRFIAVWSGADPDLKLMKEVAALKLNPVARAETFRPERAYDPANLKKFGPSNWEPFAAPELDCLDTSGKPVKLADYRGKNVLLVFYLSDQCVHCMEQLGSINKRMSEFKTLNTVVLAVSAATPQANKSSVALAPFSVKLLSDINHASARRFASYDDFEDMELHSTTLIDSKGRVRWKRSGGDPFTDVDYLLKEIKRWPK